jgi:hypothetical protein
VSPVGEQDPVTCWQLASAARHVVASAATVRLTGAIDLVTSAIKISDPLIRRASRRQ